MLLSMFMSFLLARRFHGKAYVLLMAVGLALISFFSVGLPHYYSKTFPDRTESGIFLENPLPLSFPFYASLYFERAIGFDQETYQLHFLTLIFREYNVYSVGPWGTLRLNVSWGLYILYNLFFLLVNTLGTIIGYWMSKTTFMARLLKRKESASDPLGYDENADIFPDLSPDGRVNILDATLVNAHWYETTE